LPGSRTAPRALQAVKLAKGKLLWIAQRRECLRDMFLISPVKRSDLGLDRGPGPADEHQPVALGQNALCRL
jgi:hypothetical protein